MERISEVASDNIQSGFFGAWRSPGGMREVLQIAWPLMLSTGLFSIVLFCDRLFLYQFSNVAASAALTSGSLFWTVICVPVGMLSYTSTFVAQYSGARQQGQGLVAVAQGVWLGVLFVPMLAITGLIVPWLCQRFGHAPELLEAETTYYLALIPAAISMMLASPIVGLFSGLGKTRVLLACDVVSTIVNIFLDYWLIFGGLGVPALGVVGAGAASSAACILKLILLANLYLRLCRKFSRVDANPIATFDQDLRDAKAPDEQRSALKSEHRETAQLPSQRKSLFAWNKYMAKRLMHFGWPAGVQMLVESLSFSWIMLLVGDLDETAMAATTLALNVNIVAFIPMNGLGMAVGVLVGTYLAAGKLHLAQRATRNGIAIGILYSLGFVVAYGVFTEHMLELYSWQAMTNRFEEVRPVLRILLRFIAAYCVFDALQIVFVGAIKGAGDTTYVLVASIAVSVLVVGSGIFFSYRIEPDIYYWWTVIAVWVAGMAVAFTGRYLHGGWKSKSVVEDRPAPEAAA